MGPTGRLRTKRPGRKRRPAVKFLARSETGENWDCGHQREQRLGRFIRVFQPLTNYFHCDEDALCPTKQSFLTCQKIASLLRGSQWQKNNDKIAWLGAGRGQDEDKLRLFSLKRLKVINRRTFFKILILQKGKFRIKTILNILSTEQQYISQLPTLGHFYVAYALVIGNQSQCR